MIGARPQPRRVERRLERVTVRPRVYNRCGYQEEDVRLIKTLA
jgi:hypothetical protein